MSKTTFNFGQFVFGQLISLIEPLIITKASKTCDSDKHVKKFKNKDHLISILICAFAKYSSLIKVSGTMLGLAGKTQHFQLYHIPKKSTHGDPNQRQDAEVFGIIYNNLFLKYGHIFSDSRIKNFINKQMNI
ncbi:MAG: DUF4372 domain-containing protein [Bacteroidota bacterium]